MQIRINRELDEEFVSDVLVTAFDGQYGGAWYWANPAGTEWLGTAEFKEGETSADVTWRSARIKLSEETGIGAIDSHDHFVVDEEVLRVGIQRICDEDFVVGDGRTTVNSRICDAIRNAVAEGDAGEIDADFADCIVQVGIFGGVIYG